MVRAMRLAIEAVDTKLEQAAATLGAKPASVFISITLPLIAPGILAGTIMGFAKAIGEFGATITFVANIPGQTQTLPSAIYSFLQIPGGEGRAIALVLLACVIAITAVALSEWLAQRVAKRIRGNEGDT
jgi:molybdate transport system permease protein